MNSDELLRALPVGVFAVGVDGRIGWANARAEALLKLPAAAGKSVRECLPADLADSIEHQVVSKGTGALRSLTVGEITVVVAPAPDGAIVAVMPTGIPSHLGHELKTPLTSIKAYTEAIDMMADQDQMKQFLRVILDETDRMIGMIDREVARWRNT